MLPVAAYALLQSIDLMSSGCRNFARQCIKGLVATSKGPDMVNQGLMTVTNLVPHIGYDAAAKIAKKASASGRTVAQVALEETSLSAAELATILDPLTMVEPNRAGTLRSKL
jgi:fumarate hydratase class II